MTAPAQASPAVIPPLETEQDALALPQVKAICEAMRSAQMPGRHADEGRFASQAMLSGALVAAGVETGAYDHTIIRWLAQWEPQVCAVIAGFILRAGQRRDEHPARLVLRDDEFTLLSSMMATLRSALADAIAYRSDVAAQGARQSPPQGKRDLDLAASYAAVLDEMGGVK